MWEADWKEQTKKSKSISIGKLNEFVDFQGISLLPLKLHFLSKLLQNYDYLFVFCFCQMINLLFILLNFALFYRILMLHCLLQIALAIFAFATRDY